MTVRVLARVLTARITVCARECVCVYVSVREVCCLSARASPVCPYVCARALCARARVCVCVCVCVLCEDCPHCVIVLV